LALFPKNDKIPKEPESKPHSVLFWTRGSVFTKIVGEHLGDVEGLEKHLKEKPAANLSEEF